MSKYVTVSDHIIVSNYVTLFSFLSQCLIMPESDYNICDSVLVTVSDCTIVSDNVTVSDYVTVSGYISVFLRHSV